MHDSIDTQLINLLRQNARISNVDMAKHVGLSPSACLRRLRLLETSGAIRGYTAILGTPGAEDTTTVLVQISLERQSEDCMRKFEAAVRKRSEVRECFLMAGMTDYHLRVETRGMADYERVHTEVLSRLPGVARIQSNFAIRNVVR